MDQPVKPAGKKEKKKIEDYEVEGALSDMVRVEKHKENPELMEKVHALAGRHMKAVEKIKSIDDIRKARDMYPKKKPKGSEL